MKKFVEDVCDAVGRIFATCKLKYDEANKKAIAAQKAANEEMKISEMVDLYPLVAEMLSRAICNINNAIQAPLDFADIMCKIPVRKLHSGLIVWVFRVHLKRGNTYPAEAVRRTLQEELNKLCGIYGFPPLTIRVQFSSDDLAFVAVAFSADVAAINKVQI